MSTSLVVRTERLLLRAWRQEDLPIFAETSACPKVMEHFSGVQSRDQSDQMAFRLNDLLLERGWGLWAVEVPDVAPFIGFVGLHVPTFDAHFTPCVEIGWRIHADYWGRGYAPEGAREALRVGFEELGLYEIVAMTLPANLNSRRVMEKIGMDYDPQDDFLHPKFEPGHRLSEHVLYRVSRGSWAQSARSAESEG